MWNRNPPWPPAVACAGMPAGVPAAQRCMASCVWSPHACDTALAAIDCKRCRKHHRTALTHANTKHHTLAVLCCAFCHETAQCCSWTTCSGPVIPPKRQGDKKGLSPVGVSLIFFPASAAAAGRSPQVAADSEQKTQAHDTAAFGHLMLIETSGVETTQDMQDRAGVSWHTPHMLRHCRLHAHDGHCSEQQQAPTANQGKIMALEPTCAGRAVQP